MRCWCRDGDSNSGLPDESRHVLAIRRARRIGSPTRTRTWTRRLTIGRPAVGRSGKIWWSTSDLNRARPPCKGDPRTLRVPRYLPGARGPDPLAPVHGALGEKGPTPANARNGVRGRFRARLSAASTRRFHQISFPDELKLVRPTGIEPMSARWHRAALPLSYGRSIELVHRAGLEPAKPEGT